MEFQLSYLKSWKMILWKCCTQYVRKFGKLSSGHRTGSQFSFQSQRRAMPKKVQINAKLYSFHMLARLCSKYLKLGFSYMWTENVQMFKLDLEQGEEPEIKLSTSIGSQKKQQNYRKTSTSALLTILKPLNVWITQTGKFLRRWEYQTTLPTSWEICMQVKKQQLELDMEQQTGSKLGKEYIKALKCHPVYLTFLQSTSCEMPGWMRHKLESRLPGEISITSICRRHHPYGRKQRGTKKPLDERERREWKSWLKTQHSKN